MEGPKHVSFVIRHLCHLMDRSFCTIKNDTGETTAYHGRIIGYLFDRRNEDVFQKDIENNYQLKFNILKKLLPWNIKK